MQLASQIVRAVVAGAEPRDAETSRAFEDAYDGLIFTLKARLSGSPDAEWALRAVMSKPDSTCRRALLREELESLELDSDREVIEMSESVLEIADAELIEPSESKYVDVGDIVTGSIILGASKAVNISTGSIEIREGARIGPSTGGISIGTGDPEDSDENSVHLSRS